MNIHRRVPAFASGLFCLQFFWTWEWQASYAFLARHTFVPKRAQPTVLPWNEIIATTSFDGLETNCGYKNEIHKVTHGQMDYRYKSDLSKDNVNKKRESANPKRIRHFITSTSKEKLPLQVVIIDNYDSYTYNLYQYLSELCDRVIVIPNDQFSTWEEARQHLRERFDIANVDGIILSPGPGRPDVDTDVGVCKEAVLSNPDTPILGVCLGHQLLGHLNGASVTRARRPMHGRISNVRLLQRQNQDVEGMELEGALSALFENIPSNFDVTRYHSLSVRLKNKEERLTQICKEEVIKPLAYSSDDGELMALAIENRPHVGVQFHPESVGTEQGKMMIMNWCRLCMVVKEGVYFNGSWGGKASLFNWGKFLVDKDVGKHVSTNRNGHRRGVNKEMQHAASNAQKAPQTERCSRDMGGKYRILVHKVANCTVDASLVYERLYADEPISFWLDSSSTRRRDNTQSGPESWYSFDPRARFSIMGTNDGPFSHFVEYYGASSQNHIVRVCRRGNAGALTDGGNSCRAETLMADTYENVDILSFLKKELFGVDELLQSRSVLASNDHGHYGTRISHFEMLDRECVMNGIGEVAMYADEGGGHDGEDENEDEDEDQDEDNSRLHSILPFDYRGGYVGYIGYEVRHDTTRRIVQGGNFSSRKSEPHYTGGVHANDPTRSNSNGTMPDAAFIFADRSLVFDHFTGDVYLVGYAMNDEGKSGQSFDNVRSWMRHIRRTLQNLKRWNGNSVEGSRQLSQSKYMDNERVPSFPENANSMTYNATFELKRNSRFSHSSFVSRRSKRVYESDIERCHNEIREGETYELCLTNQFELDTSLYADVGAVGSEKRVQTKPFETKLDTSVDPYAIYSELRRSNSSPFAAFLRFDPHGRLPRGRIPCSEEHPSQEEVSTKHDNLSMKKTIADCSLAICCSSPERFLSLSKSGVLESKPIKGTSSRGSSPEIDAFLSSQLKLCVKNQAENLMIVDLVRNDFGRVCDIGSVSVPTLCDVESYATVHQLVSTIRGQVTSVTPSASEFESNIHSDTILANKTAVDAIATCFPGGSMTGAPKLRTMEILHDLEQSLPRGPYSGCIGYISPNNAMDMNIVIRTAIMTPSPSRETDGGMKISIGAGGAITALSDCEDEYQEMLLKSQVVMDAVLKVLNQRVCPTLAAKHNSEVQIGSNQDVDCPVRNGIKLIQLDDAVIRPSAKNFTAV